MYLWTSAFLIILTFVIESGAGRTVGCNFNNNFKKASLIFIRVFAEFLANLEVSSLNRRDASVVISFLVANVLLAGNNDERVAERDGKDKRTDAFVADEFKEGFKVRSLFGTVKFFDAERDICNFSSADSALDIASSSILKGALKIDNCGYRDFR